MGRCTFASMHVRHIETLSLPTTLVSQPREPNPWLRVSVVRICSSVFIKPAQFVPMLASSWPSLFQFLLFLLPCFPVLNYRVTHKHILKQSRRRRTTTIMGISNIPNLSEGVIPALVVNTVLSVVLLKNMLRSVLEAVGVTSASSSSPSSSSYSQNMEEDSDEETERESWRRRRVSITQYKVCRGTTSTTTTTTDSGSSVGGLLPGTAECCVCLCGFEANQEVSELPCKHFFHRACLDKWFDNKHFTCPLCRSID